MVAHGSNTIPAGLSISSFNVDIASTMSKFKPLTEYATKGADTLQVGVILPDTTSSTRYVDFDQPYLNDAFADAGYTQAQYRIDNAQGSDATELDDATADINLGAKVLVMDPLDGPTGVAIAQLAESKGVTMISYDRATFQGTKTYYVSFNNELVGELIGRGFESCLTSWGISKPKVFVLNGGEDTDPNAISFAEGYNKVVWGQATKSVNAGATNAAGDSLVGENFAPGWDNTKGGTIFQQEYTAHPEINATIEANDGLSNAVITDLDGGRGQALQGPDHRPGRHCPGHGLDPRGLPVRLGVQGGLQGGPGHGRPGHHPVGRRQAAFGSAERHHRRPGRLEHHRAGVPADPGVGGPDQHGADSGEGRLRHCLGDLHHLRSDPLHQIRDLVISWII